MVTKDSFTALLVYIDDIVVASNSIACIESLKNFLNTSFKIKDLDPLRYFLSIEVARSTKGIHLCQRKYTLAILSNSGTLGSKPAKLPMDQNLKLHKDSGTPLQDCSSFRRLIGRLLYLTITRLNINQDLLLSANSPLNLYGYCDSDWASCPDTRKSTIGFCLFIGQSLVSWKSKKQSVVSRSSTKAEYRAMAATCCEFTWIRQIFHNLSIPQPNLAILHYDNQAALHIDAKPVFHERTKHIK
ncbi:uncharacterized protein LOC116143138 [Pistacia vera]|uniref:uncharacterized protein LOC116143138 n=1 Tax=Pistacia vera TaxID=55513 RepID=UPI0012637733|nr:uncharacterized protein LOC116143138 [Pistacia vera]